MTKKYLTSEEQWLADQPRVIQALTAVQELNSVMYHDCVEDNYHYLVGELLRVESTGDECIVTFLGINIWNSLDDCREWREGCTPVKIGKDWQEPLKDYLVSEIKKLLEVIARLRYWRGDVFI